MSEKKKPTTALSYAHYSQINAKTQDSTRRNYSSIIFTYFQAVLNEVREAKRAMPMSNTLELLLGWPCIATKATFLKISLVFG